MAINWFSNIYIFNFFVNYKKNTENMLKLIYNFIILYNTIL